MELFVTSILFLFPLFIIGLIGYSVIKGAPYAPLSQERIQVMIKLLQLKKGQKVADLGSGDGRIVIAFAKQGIEAHGYEINPVLVLISKWYIKRYHLQDKAFIHLSDFWNTDLSPFDAITLYGINHMMTRLEKKLLIELRPQSKVVSNHFQFPHWKSNKLISDVRLYIK